MIELSADGLKIIASNMCSTLNIYIYFWKLNQLWREKRNKKKSAIRGVLGVVVLRFPIQKGQPKLLWQLLVYILIEAQYFKKSKLLMKTEALEKWVSW